MQRDDISADAHGSFKSFFIFFKASPDSSSDGEDGIILRTVTKKPKTWRFLEC